MTESLRFFAAIPFLAALLSGCAGAPARIAYTTPVSRITFAAVDIETTGLSAQNARIIEIGVIRFRGGVTLDQRSWLINPGIPVPASAGMVHGITSEMVRNSPSFADVMPEFERYIRGTVVLAHNARYEADFFKAETARAAREPPSNIVVDTLPLCRKWFPDALRHSLEYMAEYLKLRTQRQHRALDDAATLRSVFNRGQRAQSPGMVFGDLVKTAGGEYRLDGKKETVEAR